MENVNRFSFSFICSSPTPALPHSNHVNGFPSFKELIPSYENLSARSSPASSIIHSPNQVGEDILTQTETTSHSSIEELVGSGPCLPFSVPTEPNEAPETSKLLQLTKNQIARLALHEIEARLIKEIQNNVSAKPEKIARKILSTRAVKKMFKKKGFSGDPLEIKQVSRKIGTLFKNYKRFDLPENPRRKPPKVKPQSAKFARAIHCYELDPNSGKLRSKKSVFDDDSFYDCANH